MRKNGETASQIWKHIALFSIVSDHRIVSYKERLSLLANMKTLPRKLIYNWPLFKSDISLQEKYAIEIKNGFINLSCKAMNTFQIHMNDS